MPVPKRHKTKSRRNQRRMHLFLTVPALTACQKCGKSVLPHRVCPHCGYYKAREVVNVLARLDKKEKKEMKTAMKEKEKRALKMQKGKP